MAQVKMRWKEENQPGYLLLGVVFLGGSGCLRGGSVFLLGGFVFRLGGSENKSNHDNIS